jgi:thymidylate synthase
MANSIDGETVGEAWETSLGLFLQSDLNRYNSRGEPCIEVEDLQLRIAHPDREPRVSPLFPEEFDPFIEDFTDRLLSSYNGRGATINERLFRWRERDGGSLNQLQTVTEMLAEDPDTRHGVIGFWDPELDIKGSTPVGPLLAYFRIRDGNLNATVVSRSLDALTGAVQLMVGFANLQRYVAEQASVDVGHLVLDVFSYHLHDMDFPQVFDMLRAR